MSLRDTMNAAKANRKGGSKSNLTPAEYNRRKGELIHNLITHENPIVREAILSNDSCPTTQVNDALKVEQDKTVIRAILMSDKVSVKSIELFCEDARAAQFDGDVELENQLTFRLTGEAVPTPLNTDVPDDEVFQDDE